MRNGGLLFNRYRVSIWEDEKFLKINSGDGHIMGTYLMPLNYTLKMVKMVSFLLYIFTEKIGINII